jgi:two-component system response regulator NreC
VKSNVSGLSGGGKLGVLLAIPDFPMLRAGFRSIIDGEPDMRVVGDVDGSALVDELDRTGADVVIAECHPRGTDDWAAFPAIEAIKAVRPATRVIAIDFRTAGDQFSQVLKAGADGFLSREAAPDDVVSAVRSVSRGQTYVSPAVVTRMVNAFVLHSDEPTAEDSYASLTEREREVLLLAAVGHTNREIAGKLGLPEGRVHHYRATVMEKLGLHDRVELLKYAIRRGVLGVADV